MCGISGIVSRAVVTPHQQAAVARMNATLRHRGPDGEGSWSDNGVLLAMRRLSIIDLAGGAQPLFNEDESVALVMNGEIYNYRELRAGLIAAGHRFRTETDGEVIAHLYEQHGLEFVHHLRGMFAIALWDSVRKRLLLVRDRMGEKPLYLTEAAGHVYFASELKALLRTGAVPFELDPAAVHLYFHYQYVPEPLTPVRGVRKLDAGSMLVVDIEPWHCRELRYWRMDDAAPIDGDPAVLIRECLDSISRIVVRSDVPVGMALSGGLDSSVVAALIAKVAPAGFSAFAVGYPGRPPNDERRDAEVFARQLGIPFHEVELSIDDAVDAFPALNYWRDDPIADIAGFGYFAVMRAAREHGIPVMLQGQGGDELFWGYEELRRAVTDSLAKQRDRRRGVTWLRQLSALRRGVGAFKATLAVPATRMPFYDRAPDYRLAAEGVTDYYSDEFSLAVEDVDPSRLFSFALPWPPVETTLTSLVCATYLRENGITQGDRLGMASSVELRLPFMDHLLVETVIGLRKAQSDAALSPKAWLKAATADLIPPEVMNRPKRGFAPPTLDWHNALFARYGDTLLDGHLRSTNVLSESGARALAAGPFPAGAIAPLSYKALVLEQWCRQMLPLVP